MKLKKILCSALTVLSMVGSPLMIQAQEQNNPIEGSVLDPKGGAIRSRIKSTCAQLNI